MTKFKIGDKVKVVNINNPEWVGTEGIILYSEGDMIFFKCTKIKESLRRWPQVDSTLNFLESRFVLVKNPTYKDLIEKMEK